MDKKERKPPLIWTDPKKAEAAKVEEVKQEPSPPPPPEVAHGASQTVKPSKTPMGGGTKLLLAIFIFWLAGTVMRGCAPPPPPLTPEEQKQHSENVAKQKAKQKEKQDKEEAANAVFQANVEKIVMIAMTLKNPSSFKIVRVSGTSASMCVLYSGTNAFNATLQKMAYIDHGTIDSESCNPYSGKDQTYGVNMAVERYLERLR